TFCPETDDSPLMEKLLDRGICRPYMNGEFHPGGIDIDADLHPLDAAGKPNPAMWAIGFLVEGAHFYTHALPRPMIHSRHTTDAHKCVAQLLGSIAQRLKMEPPPLFPGSRSESSGERIATAAEVCQSAV